MANAIPNELTKNFGDIQCRRKLIQQYGGSKFPYSGVNESNEEVLVSIGKDGMVVRTNQSNGWVRVNYYDADGWQTGETYDGRWKSREEQAC